MYLLLNIYNDIGEDWSIGFQDEGSIIMNGITDLHDHIFYYLIIILTIVMYFILLRITINKGFGKLKYINHSTIVETIWTIVPAVILILIAIPSFKLLYSLEEVIKPCVTLKIKGNQWFWSYNISDIENHDINFDSYTKTDDDLELGELRLLDVDNRVLLPIHTPIRLLITSTDVIHSWAIPSLGIKTDAIPGRINHASLYILRPGVYYGQCSELCGNLHPAMSCVVEAVSKSRYIEWLLEKINE